MKLKDILNEVRISRGITIEIFENNIMVNEAKLNEVTLAYVEGTDRLYRAYLSTENGQINLSGGNSGLNEFLNAIQYDSSKGKLGDYLEQYGVKLDYTEFDVS
tara:strand:- start:539 stop:847 length:309 start_codon:yes stop_codon:yes gene_type:complete